MSANIKTSATVEVAFCRYRGMAIKKAEPVPAVSVLETRDFKIGPYGKVEVVVTGKQDYQALVMSMKEKCGLDYVMKLAKIQGKDFIKDGLGLAPVSEFGDTTVLPETVQEGKEILKQGDESKAKLDAMAKEFGMSTDDFLTAFADGTLASKVNKTTTTESEVKE